MTRRVFQTMHPRCAQCHREVDEVIEYYDQMKCQHVIIARCHGDEERAVITDQLLRSERHWSIGTVDAFQSKPIGALPKHETSTSATSDMVVERNAADIVGSDAAASDPQPARKESPG